MASTITFPTTPNAFDLTHNGIGDAFVTRLSDDGSSIIYSTFLGGDDLDLGLDLALDNFGNAYLTGRSKSISIPFPTTAGSLQTTNFGKTDVFIAKINFETTPVDFEMSISIKKAKAIIEKKMANWDVVKLIGEFWLDPLSDEIAIAEIPNPKQPLSSIRVIDEDITVSFAGIFEETILAGSFVERRRGSGRYVFEPDSYAGFIHKFLIEYKAGNFDGWLKVNWKGINLSEVESILDNSNPHLKNPDLIPFTFQVGNDKGGGELGFVVKKNNRIKKVYKFHQH